MGRQRSKGPKFEGRLSKRLPFNPLLNVVLPKIDPDVPLTVAKVPEQTEFQVRFAELVTKLINEPSEEAIELSERFDLLFQYYCIQSDHPDKWRLLAGCLAQEFIPGFMEGERAGAPQLWTPEALASLRREVDNLKAMGLSVTEACRRLLKHQGGAWKYPRCRTAEALRRRYYQAPPK